MIIADDFDAVALEQIQIVLTLSQTYCKFASLNKCTMKFNIGDKVKFIDQQGQGVVTRIINPSTVGVTTDGFELPCLVTNLIKVEKPSSAAERLFYEGKATYGSPREEARSRQSAENGKNAKHGFPVIHEEDLRDAETDNGQSGNGEQEEDNRISPLSRGYASKQPQPEGIYIGLVPIDQQFMLRGPVEFYVINYTPHTLVYSLATKGAESFYGADYASVPPYSKIFVESIEQEDLGLWTEGILQCLFYQDESPAWPLPSSQEYKIKATRIGQAENYIYPVFMREKVLLVPILDWAAHKEARSLAYTGSSREQKKDREKTDAGKPLAEDKGNPLARYMIKSDTAEVDLHVETLLATRLEFKGAKEEDYLTKQLQVFETCLNQAISRQLSKIIFIHGVGNGILKHEIEKRLKDYPGLHYMNASTLKYGRGAIEVYLNTGNK